jgi:hypothetical protein
MMTAHDRAKARRVLDLPMQPNNDEVDERAADKLIKGAIYALFEPPAQ